MAARLRGPSTVTPGEPRSRPRGFSSQLPPRSAARSTTTETVVHAFDHRGGDQDRGLLAGHGRGRDHDVALGDDPRHHLPLLAVEVVAERLRVAATALRRVGLEVELDELSRRGSRPAPSPRAARRRRERRRRAGARSRSPGARQPAPMMKTLAARSSRRRSSSWGTSSAARPRRGARLVPAIVAIDDRMSMLWARVILGMSSSENRLTPRSAIDCTAAWATSGSQVPITVCPER